MIIGKMQGDIVIYLDVVARVLGRDRLKQVYLKKSLGTKDLREANVRAKPILAGFDYIIKALTHSRLTCGTSTARQPQRDRDNKCRGACLRHDACRG